VVSCEGNPCENGGTCVVESGTPHCKCPRSIGGVVCTESKERKKARMLYEHQLTKQQEKNARCFWYLVIKTSKKCPVKINTGDT
jgi:hypothetical protein